MEVVLLKKAKKDRDYWKQTGNEKIMKRITALLKDIEKHPFSRSENRPLIYRVKDNLHCLFQFVEIHLVDFVESLLIKLSRLPQCIKPILHFSRIMAVKNVLQLIESALTLIQGEHLKQMNLQWIENGCFHN